MNSTDTKDVNFDNVYPAVIECFAVILSGYLAGRLNWISRTESSGLNTFVSHFSLPALIFHSISTLEFESINWKFLLSIFVAKCIVFLLVAVLTLLVNRPLNYGKAGLFSIFCTQSNDFALGYPIVEALYRKCHKDFSSYLYLAAPISLVILNPIGFVLLEIEKHNRSSDTPESHQNRHWIILKIVRGVLFNPIVLMTVAGILGNVIFQHKVPAILDGILKVLGSAFSATALFALGLHMVGKVSSLKGKALVAPAILIVVKILVLPIIIRETVSLIQPGSSSNETVDFSMFGFLYGTFPTAPGAFVFATQYGLDTDLIASSMVACTFISAPMMFLSAKMITLEVSAPTEYLSELNKFLFDISVLSLISCVWVAVIFTINKKWKRIPHSTTMCLVVSQLISCIGTVLWNYMPNAEGWKLYLQFVIFMFGVYSSRIWGALLAINLYLLRWRSLCFVLKIRSFFFLTGWGIPAIIVTLLCVFGSQEMKTKDKINPNFPFGLAQAFVSSFLILTCLIIMIFCLVMQQRIKNRASEYRSLLTNDDPLDSVQEHSSLHGSINASDKFSGSLVCCQGDVCKVKEDKTASCCLQDVEDFGNTAVAIDSDQEIAVAAGDNLCSTSFPCNSRQRQMCAAAVKHYQTMDESQEPLSNPFDEYQMLHHTILLLILCLSALVGFALCAWHLVMEDPSGIYIELEFLDGALNFGQGLFLFVLFGLDNQLLVSPFMEKWRKFWYKLTHDPSSSQLQHLNAETKLICQQFIKYHYSKCVTDLVRDRRIRTKCYKSVLCGNELVDWLLAIGLAHDRNEAIAYGQNLILGHILRHVEEDRDFCDMQTFYSFQIIDGRTNSYSN